VGTLSKRCFKKDVGILTNTVRTFGKGKKSKRQLRQGQDSNLRARRHPLYFVIAGERVNHSTTLTGYIEQLVS
jgi:hypothetical protein